MSERPKVERGTIFLQRFLEKDGVVHDVLARGWVAEVEQPVPHLLLLLEARCDRALAPSGYPAKAWL